MKKKIIIALVLVLVLAAFGYLIYLTVQKSREASQRQNISAVQQTPASTVVTENKTSNNSIDFSQTATNIESKINKGTATAEDLMNLGIAYYNLQKTDQAIKTYNDLIIKDPNSANSTAAYKNLGNIYRDQKKYRDAETSYRMAIQIDPQFVTAYINLAYMLFSIEGNQQGALVVLQQGLAQVPDDPTLKNLYTEYQK